MVKLIPLTILAILAFVQNSYQSTVDDDFYWAAAIEFTPSWSTAENTASHVKFIKNANENIDIIVMSEAALNYFGPYIQLPTAEDKVIPCNNGSYNFLSDLSCAAKDSKKYVVVHLYEKERCTEESQKAINDPRKCSESGWNKFNTAVTLDREGRIIAKYRKTHLYNEPGVNVTHIPEVVYFDTDFGVRFGMFICFDILFESPGQILVRKLNITDLVLLAHWYSEKPFFSAIQTFQAWSYGNDVNLIAAGGNIWATGSTGTAIFNGRNGPLIGGIHSGPRRIMYVAKVPKKNRIEKSENSKSGFMKKLTKSVTQVAAETNEVPSAVDESNRNVLVAGNTRGTVTGASNLDTVYVFKDDSLRRYKTYLVNFDNYTEATENQYHKNVCHNDFCCDFNITKKMEQPNKPNTYVYRVGAFSGERERYGKVSMFRNCAFMACKDYSVDSCGEVFRGNDDVMSDEFEQLEIQGTFPKNDKLVFFVSSIDKELVPIHPDSFTFVQHDHDPSWHVIYKTNVTTKDILTFNVGGNYYTGGAGASYISVLLVLASAISSIRFA